MPSAAVTPGFFRLLGLNIVHGRDFTDADGAPLPTTACTGGRSAADTAVVGTVQQLGAQSFKLSACRLSAVPVRRLSSRQPVPVSA